MFLYRLRKRGVPSASFKWRIFLALVAISSVTSLAIGVVLYYFASNRMIDQEEESLLRRSRTANVGAGVFVEGLRNPEDKSFPAPASYAEELVRSVDDTGLGTLYIAPSGRPLAARDGLGGSLPPRQSYEELGITDSMVDRAEDSSPGEGWLVPRNNSPHYITLWPLSGPGGEKRGVMVYYSPESGLQDTLSSLRLGIVGAIGTSIFLAGFASLLLSRQITRPLSETKDAALKLAAGEYIPVPAADRRDEIGELGRAFNYMSFEIERHVKEIQEQKSRLEAVLEASPEAVVQTDGDERIITLNPAARAILGLGSEHEGRKIAQAGVHEELIRCLREASVNGMAVREIDDGEKSLWAYAARMSGIGGTILAVRDITEHRALEKSKTEFLSDVSHELRNPLTTIQTAASVLSNAEDRLEPHERRVLELAEQELGRMRGMIEELLTLAKMDSRRYSLVLGSGDLTQIIEEAIESVGSKAQRFGIELSFTGDKEHQITCDSRKLYHVFLNLLDNAVKYSESGTKVEVEVQENEDNTTIHIRDNGEGIPEEDLPQLFERFYRVDKNRSRSTGGTGLGLSIAREIVRLHGGDIGVQSEVGVGSTFSVVLPKSPLPRSANYAI